VTGPSAADLLAAAAAAQELLGRVPDFAAEVPAMDGDVRGVVVHIASCLTWYAHDLVAGPPESVGPTAQWPSDSPPADLARELGIAAGVLARVVATAGPDDRGWHPWGVADATGFAAIGIAELVLHTHDVASAHGLPWSPPAGPVAATLARLFPDVPADGDPWAAMLWATGRGDLPGRDPVTAWRYAMEPAVTGGSSPGSSSRP
jgi:hypothetical protein